MNLQEFKDQLITEGIASVEKNETRPERIRGGLIGFEICRQLSSIWDFQEELERRHKEESSLIKQQVPLIEYWEYRTATAQVEYVYERMLVVWSKLGLYEGPLSARAVLRTADIVGVEREINHDR